MIKPFYKITLMGYYKLLRYYMIIILQNIRFFILKKYYNI